MVRPKEMGETRIDLPSWKQPDATHIVLYKKRAETKLKELDGRVACKLTADNHGRSEWWLLLERVES